MSEPKKPKEGRATNDADPTDERRSDGETVKRSGRVAVVIAGVVTLLVASVVGLYLHAAAGTNHEAMASLPRPVTVVKAKRASFRPARTYVATLQPWVTAKLGPQFISAYVGTVLVRPGAVVKRGDVLATLDCRASSGASKEIAAKARAVAERQTAEQHESVRLKELTSGGFASPNELEQLTAKSNAEASEVDALKASLSNRALAVDDCIVRAPFEGEISDRMIDPGAYVRPGNTVVTVIDRSTVRVVADAPESDFAVVAPGTPVKITVLATGVVLHATVTRRTPAADEQTRTVHFEIDVANADHALPVGTTATLDIDVGTAAPATSVPLRAATVRGAQATLFVVDGEIAKRVVDRVLGTIGGVLYLDPKLDAGSAVVIEGRALLDDGDRVAAKELAP